MMLTMNSEVSDYGSWETGSYVYEEDDEYETDDDPQGDAPDVNAHEDEGRNADEEEVGYSDDEAFARAIQEAEEREMADRLSALTGLANREYNTYCFHSSYRIGWRCVLNCVVGCRG